MNEEVQQPQWFITADGTVIQAWPPGPDSDRTKYSRYSTTRPLELSDLYAFDERRARFDAAFNRGVFVFLILVGLGVVGLVLSWLVLPRIGVDDNVTTVLLGLSLLVIVLGPVTRAIQGGSRARLEQIYVDAGFESSEPRGLKPREAQALIEAPGTVAER